MADLKNQEGMLQVKVGGIYLNDFSLPHQVDCHTNIDESETIPNTGSMMENKLEEQVQASRNHPKIQPKKKTTLN